MVDMITVHTIVKNESIFVKQALTAVLSSRDVSEVLVWDTGSIDETVNEILSIKDKRIKFQQRGNVNRKELVFLRQEQIKLTRTPWFLLVDGDEIWPQKNLNKLTLAIQHCNNGTIALVNRSRNVVGDIYHYLPESEGHYQIGPWRGHLNIRAIRNVSGLTARGIYPDEWYELDGVKIQDQANRLTFVDAWYLHTTHMRRSGSLLAEFMTIDRWKKRKRWYGLRGKKLLKMNNNELPEMMKA